MFGLQTQLGRPRTDLDSQGDERDGIAHENASKRISDKGLQDIFLVGMKLRLPGQVLSSSTDAKFVL